MEFKIKTKASIHNKFHVEVRNADSGELKQEGFAENIVTDEMYSNNGLMGFNHTFNGIAFGGGVGTPSPSDTRLFNEIGAKSGKVDERIWSHPVSSVTKSVVLGTTEFNGTTITEVGIYRLLYLNDGAGIVTHAMLKDAEGNPLSIAKTSSDVITIYATLYIELVDDPQAKGKFNEMPNYNPIVMTVIDRSWVSVTNRGGGASNNGVMVGSAGGPAPYNYMKLIDKHLGVPKYYSGFNSIIRDLDSRKIKWETRLDVNSANFDIEEIGLALGGGSYQSGVSTRYIEPELAYRLDLTDSYVWTPYRLKDLELGTGDGLNTEFNIGRHRTSDIEVKVDGQSVSGYTLRNVNDNNKERMSLLDFIDEELSYASVHNIGEGLGISNDVPIEFNDDIIGKQLSFYSTTSSSRVTGHRDGTSYNIPLVGNNNKRTAVIEENYDYFTFSWLTTSQPIVEDPDYVQPAVVFNNPPADGVPVTISYTVPYIPKTEDYVLDLSFEIEWL